MTIELNRGISDTMSIMFLYWIVRVYLTKWQLSVCQAVVVISRAASPICSIFYLPCILFYPIIFDLKLKKTFSLSFHTSFCVVLRIGSTFSSFLLSAEGNMYFLKHIPSRLCTSMKWTHFCLLLADDCLWLFPGLSVETVLDWPHPDSSERLVVSFRAGQRDSFKYISFVTPCTGSFHFQNISWQNIWSDQSKICTCLFFFFNSVIKYN